ncbi:MAG TPA: tetratricopeptide repeat protein [Gemmataceae bacterium]|nr:tetratricopeptide repeat protein [Gemmataceae bacterium]
MAKESVDSLYQKAQHAVAQGDNGTARGLYMQALGLKSDAPEVHYGMATVCFLLNDLPSAAYHFKEVTRLDPHRAGAHINLGAIYNRMDMLDEAIPVLRRGIQLDHNRAEGFYNLGIVYRRKGQIDMAIQAYREAVRINPRMFDAHYNIANLYFEKQQYSLALAHYKQALAARPTWDKAKQGLEQCEAALHGAAAQPAGPSAGTPQGNGHAKDAEDIHLDPHHTVDPGTHGLLLSSLHKATIESDTMSRSLLSVMETEVEPAIKDLSSCLMLPGSTAQDVEQCLQKFESAIVKLRTAQKELGASLHQVQKMGDKLVRS